MSGSLYLCRWDLLELQLVLPWYVLKRLYLETEYFENGISQFGHLLSLLLFFM